MNKDQVANLRYLQKKLTELPGLDIKRFNINSRVFCAWGKAIKYNWFPGAPAWGYPTPECWMKSNFGLSNTEQEFIFTGTGLHHAEPKASLHYDTCVGSKAIRECIDRIENVIQYHLSTGQKMDYFHPSPWPNKSET